MDFVSVYEVLRKNILFYDQGENDFSLGNFKFDYK